jgi:hypothetical protein
MAEYVDMFGISVYQYMSIFGMWIYSVYNL